MLNQRCPDCERESFRSPAENHEQPSEHLTRRHFLKKVGRVAAGVGMSSLLIPPLLLSRGMDEPAEEMVRMLRKSLTGRQRDALLLPWADPRRLRVGNNWRVVRERIGQAYTSEQREMIREILRRITSEQGYDKIQRAMRDDAGGLDNYSACLFAGDENQLAFMLTGRHQTIRADGGADENAVFGGPLFYGHAVDFNERPDHPGNVWWHQSRLASKVYHALDGRQQKLALVTGRSPADSASSVRLQGSDGRFSGIPVADLSPDQQALVRGALRALLEPYRESDVEEVMRSIESNGGLDSLHMSFYKDGDLPDEDGIWDRWRIEGPALVWYFRGSPHVHTWVNIAHRAIESA